jgi:hypothetical protein
VLLAEQFQLFQLDGDTSALGAAYKGHTKRSAQDDIAGAICLELALRGRLAMDAAAQLVVADATPLGDGVLDQALTTFAQAAPTSDARKWFDSVGARGLQDVLSQRLSQQDWRAQKHALKDTLRSIIFGSARLDQHTAALIVLLDVCWLMTGEIVANKEEKTYRKRFDHLFPDYLDWLADYETDMGTVLLEGIARPNSNAMSAVLIALGSEFRV